MLMYVASIAVGTLSSTKGSVDSIFVNQNVYSRTIYDFFEAEEAPDLDEWVDTHDTVNYWKKESCVMNISAQILHLDSYNLEWEVIYSNEFQYGKT